MLDPKLFRTDIEQTAQLLAKRGFTLDVAQLSALEVQRKEIQIKTQELQVNVILVQSRLDKLKHEVKIFSRYLLRSAN